LIAFLISALVFGVTIVFVIPFAQAQVNRFPGFAKVTANRFVQVLVIGSIGLLVLALFGWMARGLKVKM
jgi:hypothetical protein